MSPAPGTNRHNIPPANPDRSLDVEPSPTDSPHPNGLIAAATLRAARLSASLSRRQLADAIYVRETDILSWEVGTTPLASTRVTVIEELKAALRAAGAEPDLIADMDAALWCDLVIEAITEYEDASCLLTDPQAAEPAFRELLAWAVGGKVPARYRPFADDAVAFPTADDRAE